MTDSKPKMRQRKIKLWTWVSCEHGEQDIRVCWHCYQQAILAADKAAKNERDREWAAVVTGSDKPNDDWLQKQCRNPEFARGFLQELMKEKEQAARCLGLIRALGEGGGEDG